ncbi:MFS transporter [Noviherbaspirillum sedimenti]|uniref:MFS transporter n=1 Tax=Noviherbaspirillum sedimenti TaxID=2320865 RepID=A0A3A3GDD8_9BURK|nr:MFS transporter [Noviherbaspirillum sedimenti]RJG00246.1 MFS transporter [Noviherbaspirillum sedimenti]
MRPALRAEARPRDVWAWAMYDFANSGYTTVVITALFNAYFVAVVADGQPWATLAWTAALAVSYLAVLATAPVVGAFADLRAAKKRLLALSTAGCVLFTALLYFAQPGALWLAVACLVLSNFFFGTGENLIAAFLPELARGRGMGRVSGWGWGLGYLGGLFTLGLCLAWIAWAEKRGQGAADYVPVAMLITAAVFALASLPTLLLLPERAVPREGRALDAWREVARTLRSAAGFPDLRRFLTAALCYQAGVHTVIALAAIYANQAMGFTTQQTLLLVLAVNVAAAAGAFLFGHVQDRLGPVRAIAWVLVGWLFTIVLAALARTPGTFWAAAHLAGLCLGASQSGGRALVGLLSPPSRRAEFFGFWGLATKLSAILGPLSYGLVTWASDGDHRRALWATGLFFVVGLALLTGVHAGRGRRAALRAERALAKAPP